MKNIKDLAEKVAKKTVTGMIKKDFLDWPPGCMGYLYQPEKPATIKFEEDFSETTDKV